MNRDQFLMALAGVAAVFTLGSCTTNQTADLLPPMPKVEAHVLSGDVTQKRDLASTTDESILDAEFQQTLSADDVASETRDHIERAARIFYHTQGLLNDYDAKIDDIINKNSPSSLLQTDDTYARLISAWTIREEQLAKLKYFYSRALEVEMQGRDDSAMSREMASHALTMENAFKDALVSAPNSTNRLAKQDLIDEIMTANQTFHDFQVARENGTADIVKRADAFNDLLKKQIIQDGEDFYSRNATQLKRETENSRKDEELNKEIERALPEVKHHLADQFDGRAPAAAGGYAPSPGRKGMINGNEFSAGVWALTFDDGPHPVYTVQDLANLQNSGVKATFFWLANNVSRLKSVVLKAKDAEMTLGNHSFSHPQLPKLGPSGLVHEIDESTQVDIATYGFKPKFFRCPYGACGSQNSTIRQKIAAQGMLSVTWNVDTLDWQDKNPASVYARAKKQMSVQKHGIILFHDIHPQSVAASKMLMSDFQAGRKTGQYRTVTIQQAFDELNSSEGMK